MAVWSTRDTGLRNVESQTVDEKGGAIDELQRSFHRAYPVFQFVLHREYTQLVRTLEDTCDATNALHSVMYGVVNLLFLVGFMRNGGYRLFVWYIVVHLVVSRHHFGETRTEYTGECIASGCDQQPPPLRAAASPIQNLDVHAEGTANATASKTVEETSTTIAAAHVSDPAVPTQTIDIDAPVKFEPVPKTDIAVDDEVDDPLWMTYVADPIANTLGYRRKIPSHVDGNVASATPPVTPEAPVTTRTTTRDASDSTSTPIPPAPTTPKKEGRHARQRAFSDRIKADASWTSTSGTDNVGGNHTASSFKTRFVSAWSAMHQSGFVHHCRVWMRRMTRNLSGILEYLVLCVFVSFAASRHWAALRTHVLAVPLVVSLLWMASVCHMTGVTSLLWISVWVLLLITLQLYPLHTRPDWIARACLRHDTQWPPLM